MSFIADEDEGGPGVLPQKKCACEAADSRFEGCGIRGGVAFLHIFYPVRSRDIEETLPEGLATVIVACLNVGFLDSFA